MAAAYECAVMEDEEVAQKHHTELIDDGELFYLEESLEEDAVQQLCSNNETEAVAKYIQENIKVEATADEICDDFSAHTLLLQEADGDAQLTDSYLCMQCDVAYTSIEEFAHAHDLSTPVTSEQEEFLDITEQQWEVVESEADESAERHIKRELNVEHCVEFIEDDTQNDTNALKYNEYYMDQHSKAVMQDIYIKEELQTNAIEETTNVEQLKEKEDDQENGQRYFCYECQSVFNDLQSAEQHDCPALSSEFETVAHDTEMPAVSTQQHRTTNSCEHKCPICARIFGSINALCSHSRTHKVKPKLEKGKNVSVCKTAICDVCNTTFGSEKNLRFHMKIHDKRPIKSIQEALPAGAKVQYNELNQFFCEICNKSFNENLLVVHKNMHQNMEEYNCGTCNRQFENLLSYEMHMKMHEDNKSSKGNRPAATSKTKLSSAKEGKLRFPCQYCGREFPRPHEKVKHERVHTGEKPYECEVCGKTFRVSYSLTLHLRTHTDIRPFVCATCNKRFKSQPVYVHHLKTHLNERAYKCDICGKAFRTSVQLCGHKNTHKKPFNCPECNRPFSTMYSVKIHMKTHNKLLSSSNELLKYRCVYCGAVYARSYALQSHIKEQHSSEGDDTQFYVKQQQHASALPTEEQYAEEDVLIAIAAETDCAAIEAIAAADSDDEADIESITESGIATQAILSNEEQIIVDNFHTEEIVTAWLTK